MTVTDDPLDTGTGVTIERDRWGRPLIVPPGGGHPTAYTRCTTYVGALEDRFNLSQWEQRMVAVGLSQRPDLLLAAGAHRDDKARLNEICGQAREAAQASAAATTGTALHRIAERLDRGEDLGAVPADFQADIEAYRQVTAEFDHEHIEQMLVNDEIKVAGTPDRLARWRGSLVVFDIKTGSIEYAMNKIAMQLAVYSRSSLYDPATGARTDLDINQAEAIVAHMPAGSGTCALYSVDIAAGWEGVQLCRQVRQFRALRKLAQPVQRDLGAAGPDGPPAPVTAARPAAAAQPEPTLAELIARATSAEQLTALWKTNRTTWTAAHTAAAATRKQQLLTEGTTR